MSLPSGLATGVADWLILLFMIYQHLEDRRFRQANPEAAPHRHWPWPWIGMAVLATTIAWLPVYLTPKPNPTQGSVAATLDRGRLPADPSSYRVKIDDLPPRSKIMPCENPIKATPEDVWKDDEIYTAAYNERSDSGNRGWRYKYQCIKWRLPVRGMQSRGDVIELTFGVQGQTIGVIGVQIRSEDYPELRLPGGYSPGMSFDVQGKILAVQEGRIFLKDALISRSPGDG